MDPDAETAAAGGEPGPAPLSIGAYRVLAQIGEGGFGEVYEAEQTEPVRRRVALKMIKPGMDSRAVVARFEGERQALAVMDHPCIARVFDGGVTPPELGSRPYFVMELVRGEPITRFCDTHTLSIDDRVELFIRVCAAVQHAHSKGVIHRDLKPSNVLVGYDGDGVAQPKVIDFGVAKALNQRLAEQTVFTDRGQLIGTPEYMSPEQAEMSGLDIDTRADVYSLGVLLYELLTGVLPFDAQQLREAALGEIQRIIREVDPPKPSTRLSTVLSGANDPEAGTKITRARHTDAKSLSGVLRRDLDWVVMKCLEKDRERRYDTANALAAELRRYLDDEPVRAGPPGIWYQAEKYAKRHRAGIAAGGLIALALVSAVVVSLGFAGVANAQRKIAEDESERVGELLGELDQALATEQSLRSSAERRLAAVSQHLSAAEYDRSRVHSFARSTVAALEFLNTETPDEVPSDDFQRSPSQLRANARRMLEESERLVGVLSGFAERSNYTVSRFDQLPGGSGPGDQMRLIMVDYLSSFVFELHGTDTSNITENLRSVMLGADPDADALREWELIKQHFARIGVMVAEDLEATVQERALSGSLPTGASCLDRVRLGLVCLLVGEDAKAETYIAAAIVSARSSGSKLSYALSDSLSAGALVARRRGDLMLASHRSLEALGVRLDALLHVDDKTYALCAQNLQRLRAGDAGGELLSPRREFEAQRGTHGRGDRPGLLDAASLGMELATALERAGSQPGEGLTSTAWSERVRRLSETGAGATGGSSAGLPSPRSGSTPAP